MNTHFQKNWQWNIYQDKSHIGLHKPNLIFQNFEIRRNTCSIFNGIKLEFNNKKICKMSKLLKLSITLLNKLRMKGGITRKIKNYIELNKNKNSKYQILQGGARAMLKSLHVIWELPNGQLKQKQISILYIT